MDLQKPASNLIARLSAERLATLMSGLTDTDKSVLKLLDDFHYAYGSQLQRLFFTATTHDAATRARNRRLGSLVSNKLLYRLGRQPLPGNRHGSTEYIYALTHAGQRVMNELRAHERPFRSVGRTTAHFAHALAITELHVQLMEAGRADVITLLQSEGEPACHRHYGIRRVLKPDAFALFRQSRAGKIHEVGWFIEVEHSRQGEPATIAKLRAYSDYMTQLDPSSQFMPRVLFVAFTEHHRAHLDRLLDRNAGDDRDVFTTTLFGGATKMMVLEGENG